MGGILMSPVKGQTSAVMRATGSYWVRVLVVFSAYFVAGKIGLSTPFTSNSCCCPETPIIAGFVRLAFSWRASSGESFVSVFQK